MANSHVYVEKNKGANLYDIFMVSKCKVPCVWRFECELCFYIFPEDEGSSKGEELEMMIAPRRISYNSGGI